jgi:hypothetical protein
MRTHVAPAEGLAVDLPLPAPAEAAPPLAPPVSVDEAAAALGVAPNTIRRWLKTGALRGERRERPQGALWRVYLPEQVPAAGERHVPDGTSTEPPASAHGTSLAAPPTQELARAEALAQYAAALLAPVVAQVERLQQENRDQAERIGHLTAELEQARAQLTAPAPRPPWWQRLLGWR